MTDNDSIRDTDLTAPAALVRDLRSLYHAPLAVTPEVDQRVRQATWRHFARRGRMRALRWLTPLAAAAAAVLILLPHSRQGAVGDVDGSGAVDILDAFALARRVEASESLKARWDVNGDAEVDQSDIDLIAAAAVALQ
ncbi:MAG: dockerin type I domain-containing protein [Candidatus Eisenbacteria bacterium]|jgi:hypothetical protein|nr:dockerin type I domain-containing protein [Candidatus Eisenbacteria bacterium]